MADAQPPTILSLDPSQSRLRHRVGISLARAFHDEPNFTHALPDPDQRRRSLPWFFGSFVTRLGLRHGIVDVTDDGNGAAIWLSPGEAVGAASALRAGLLTMPFRFGWRGFWRAQVLGHSVEVARTRHVPRPHWYLMALGIDPDHQGKGIGRALLTHGLARADRLDQPSYLETFRSTTARFYASHGFDEIGGGRVGRPGPAFIAMARG